MSWKRIGRNLRCFLIVVLAIIAAAVILSIYVYKSLHYWEILLYGVMLFK
ncbi:MULTISPECIES: hypothetical protein [Clostridium]|uniref:Uncharacterized protein n=1 Tax=Clostridium lapidicellarium TaxID=3240931 RepID=A0ABV4DYG6_9CLOT|nr:hypothetical protein [uncultured Clostridium sp.]